MGKISRDCERCYEWKKLELTPLSENLWAKAGPNRASIDSSEKRIMVDYQLTVLLVKFVRTTFSENSEPVWDVLVDTRGAP